MKIKRTRRWHKRLTIRQLRHIIETTQTGSLAQFKRNLEHQIATDLKQEQDGLTSFKMGWECHYIAKRLEPLL